MIPDDTLKKSLRSPSPHPILEIYMYKWQWGWSSGDSEIQMTQKNDRIDTAVLSGILFFPKDSNFFGT